MSPVVWIDSWPIRRFPRVSGDEPLEVAALDCVDEFSPRERG